MSKAKAAEKGVPKMMVILNLDVHGKCIQCWYAEHAASCVKVSARTTHYCTLSLLKHDQLLGLLMHLQISAAEHYSIKQGMLHQQKTQT